MPYTQNSPLSRKTVKSGTFNQSLARILKTFHDAYADWNDLKAQDKAEGAVNLAFLCGAIPVFQHCNLLSWIKRWN